MEKECISITIPDCPLIDEGVAAREALHPDRIDLGGGGGMPDMGGMGGMI